MADSSPTKPDGMYVRGGSAEAFDSNLDYAQSGSELPDRQEFRGILGSFAVLTTRDDESARQRMQKFTAWRAGLGEKIKQWRAPQHTPQHESAVEFASGLPAATRVWRERGLYQSTATTEDVREPSRADDDMVAIMSVAAARAREKLAQSNAQTATFRQVPRQAPPPARENIDHPNNSDPAMPNTPAVDNK